MRSRISPWRVRYDVVPFSIRLVAQLRRGDQGQGYGR
jgi:hypothetical protein